MVPSYSETSSISSFPSSLQYAITVDLIFAVILCVGTAFFLVLILSHIVFNLISRLHELTPDQILSDNNIMANRNGQTLHPLLARYNAQFLEMLERFVRDVDEGRAHRLRAHNQLPPVIIYGGSEKITGSKCLDECVICLDEFHEGQSCQVFPVCNHVFHTNCIDNWLRNRHTCPVCRHCILDV